MALDWSFSRGSPQHMIELIQIPWSPYCIAQRRILEYSGERFKIINTSSADRSYIWRITKERYYQVPVLRDGNCSAWEFAITRRACCR